MRGAVAAFPSQVRAEEGVGRETRCTGFLCHRAACAPADYLWTVQAVRSARRVHDCLDCLLQRERPNGAGCLGVRGLAQAGNSC